MNEHSISADLPTRIGAGTRKKARRNWAAAVVLTVIPVVVFASLYLAPIVYMLRFTFDRFDQARGAVNSFTLTNYTDFLGQGYYLSVLWLTVQVSLIVTGISLLIGYPVSYYLAHGDRRPRVGLITILLLPLVTSPIVVSYGWLVLLGNTGMVNNALVSLGLISQPLRLIYSQTGVVIGLVQVLVSFMVLAVTASLQAVDFTLVRAARSLGAGPSRAFWRIVFPLSLPGIRTGCLLVFSLSMSAYATPALIGGPQVKLVSFLIYEQATSLLNWPFAAAMAVILVAATTGILGLVSAYGQLRVWHQGRRAPLESGALDEELLG